MLRYHLSRLRVSRLISDAIAACRRKGHRMAHLAHTGEQAMHVAYLGGVVAGGGYRYAAIGMLVCMAIGWALHADAEV